MRATRGKVLALTSPSHTQPGLALPPSSSWTQYSVTSSLLTPAPSTSPPATHPTTLWLHPHRQRLAPPRRLGSLTCRPDPTPQPPCQRFVKRTAIHPRCTQRAVPRYARAPDREQGPCLRQPCPSPAPWAPLSLTARARAPFPQAPQPAPLPARPALREADGDSPTLLTADGAEVCSHTRLRTTPCLRQPWYSPALWQLCLRQLALVRPSHRPSLPYTPSDRRFVKRTAARPRRSQRAGLRCARALD